MLLSKNNNSTFTFGFTLNMDESPLFDPFVLYTLTFIWVS